MIHWFPGHMHKARKELAKIMPKTDVVYELVDARAPESSSNPILLELAAGKPIIKILSKKDLADPKITQEWIYFYQNKAFAINIIKDKKMPEQLIDIAQKLLPNRGTPIKPIRAIVVGIPNVGKSTLINSLAKRKITKTGNEPAVTKRQQNIMLTRNFYLKDTPGIMSPSPKSEDSSFRLAICGAIRDTAMDYPSAAYYLIRFLIDKYPEAFSKRYKLSNISLTIDDESLMHNIGKNLGTIKNNTNVNLHQVAEKIILDFRQGKIAKISLETPQNYSTSSNYTGLE